MNGDDEADGDDVADGHDDELSPTTLRRMVREIRAEWTVREATPAEEGTDVVYFLTVETPGGLRECVLKACEFLDPEAFRPEPHLLDLLDQCTSIPVPGVVGAVDDHDDLPAPFFLMERCDGEVREGDARELPPDAVERIARDAGRYLGELHGVGDFERFGPLRLARDVEREETDAGSAPSIGGGDRALTLGDAARDSWRERFTEQTDYSLENLEDRFADLEPDVRTFVDEHLDALDRPFPAVVAHHDYRLGNLLVDSETGETRAVLDWGNMSTMEAQYELVYTEQYLSEWAPHDDPFRDRVRTALREGYEATNELERDADFERRRELYLAKSRLSPLVWFSLWYENGSDAEREGAAEKHRRAIRNLVD